MVVRHGEHRLPGFHDRVLTKHPAVTVAAIAGLFGVPAAEFLGCQDPFEQTVHEAIAARGEEWLREILADQARTLAQTIWGG